MIIDTLYTIFKADTKDLIAGARQSEDAVDKVEKAMTEAEKAGQKLAESFTGMIKNAAALAASFLTVSHISGQMFHAAQNALELKKLSDATNTSMEEITKWSHAAVEFGGSADEFKDSMSRMSQSITDMSMHGGGGLAYLFRSVGVSVLDASRKAKPMNEVLLDMSTKVQRLGERRQQMVKYQLEQNGVDKATIQMMFTERSELEKILKKKEELGSLTKANAEMAKGFNVVMDEMGARMEHIYMAVGVLVIPVLNWLAKGLSNVFVVIEDNKPFFIAFATLALPLLAAAFWSVTTAARAAIVSMAIAAAPFIAIAAVVAACAAVLALFADDIYNWMEGNDSILGRSLGSWQSFKKGFTDVIDEIKKIWQDLIDNFSAGFDKIAGIIDTVKSTLGIAPDKDPTDQQNGAMDKRKAAETKAAQDDYARTHGWSGATADKAANGMAAADMSPINSQTTTSIFGDKSQQTAYNIVANATVNTAATDATGVSKAVGDTMGVMLISAMNQHDDGVRA